METHTPETTSTLERNSAEFAPGSIVMYPMHGRCLVQAVELRLIDGKPIHFYKLEVQRSTLSRSTRPEPAIWLPVQSARERGLRAPIGADNAVAVMAVLMSREYYFQINEPWSSVQPKLENIIRQEGAIGLAKAMSYTHVLIKKQIVPPSELIRFHENLSRLLFRELSEALNEQIKTLEEKVARGLRQKLLPDT